ncbi:hypothetical protein PINS_up019977 [Pythium insidiosum]|nr:hypothetical protein PINS_up019977 [Pythium insidiosum]
MKRRLDCVVKTEDGGGGGVDDQLKQALRDVLTREFLSNVLSEGAGGASSAAAAPRRFGNVPFGPTDEASVNAFLHQKLGKENLSRRAGPRGTRLTYIESCKAIELANQAFGFNGWSCRILECKEEYRERKNERWSIGFSSLVRIELKDGTSHEDFGFGQADGQPNLGAAIEQAKKASISDARKRALRLFGEYLGNSCYDREHIRDVHSNKAPAALQSGGVSIPAMSGAARPPSSNGPSNSPPLHAGMAANVGGQSVSPPVTGVSAAPRTAPVGLVQAPGQTSHSPPQTASSASAVANRISALQAAEAQRLAQQRTSGVGNHVGPGQHAGQQQSMPRPLSAQPMSHQSTIHNTSPGHINAPPPNRMAHNPVPPMPNMQPQPHRPTATFAPPMNAPPPQRVTTTHGPPRIKTEQSTRAFDMNDLSLSQFDYEPEDIGGAGAPKRMRA